MGGHKHPAPAVLGALDAAGRSGYCAWPLPTPGCLRGFILQLGTGRSIYPSWTVTSQFRDLVCETSPSQQPKGRVHGFEDGNLFSLNVDLFCWCGFSSPRMGECAGFGNWAGCSGFPPCHGLSWHVLGSCLLAPLALGSLFLIFPGRFLPLPGDQRCPVLLSCSAVNSAPFPCDQHWHWGVKLVLW